MKSDVIKYTVEIPKILLDIVADAGHLTLDSCITCQLGTGNNLSNQVHLTAQEFQIPEFELVGVACDLSQRTQSPYGSLPSRLPWRVQSAVLYT